MAPTDSLELELLAPSTLHPYLTRTGSDEVSGLIPQPLDTPSQIVVLRETAAWLLDTPVSIIIATLHEVPTVAGV